MKRSEALYKLYGDLIDKYTDSEDAGEQKIRKFAARWFFRLQRKGREYQVVFD